MNSRKSKFDSSHLVVFVEKEDEQYSKLKPMFKKHGLGFKHGKTIILDLTTLKEEGYADDAHITFIEAHELGHSLMGHSATKPQFEAEADYVGILLCENRNFKKSVAIGKKYFKQRNRISFEKYAQKNDKRIRSLLKK